MFGGDAEGVSDASAARRGGAGENRKASAEGLRACEGNKRGICVWASGKRRFPEPSDKTGARSEAEGGGLGGERSKTR